MLRLDGEAKLRTRVRRSLADVRWRQGAEDVDREGVLVGLGARGLAIMAPHEPPSRPGSRLVPVDGAIRAGWTKPVIVKHIDRISDSLDLIAAEYLVGPTTGVCPTTSPDLANPQR